MAPILSRNLLATQHMVTTRSMRTLVLGVVVAALNMTKVNLGVFAGVAVWMSFVSLLPWTRASAAVRVVSSAGNN